jgi:hypothetical protein
MKGREAGGGILMVSIWWVVGAFVVGGYAGALGFALLCMARGVDDRVPTPDSAR